MQRPSQIIPGTPLWRDPREHARGEPLPAVPLGDPRAGTPQDPPLVDRREFLAMVNTSIAAATLAGCGASQPTETIVPYVESPEQIVPGRPLFFATAVSYGGKTTGILVESHMGRPTKIEGNPLHPASLGATDAITQASVVSLYDPDRSQAIRHLGEISTWSAFLSDFRAALQEQAGKQGAGLRLLTGTVVSPTLARQIDDLRKRFPQAKWHQYDGGYADAGREAAQRLFGRPIESTYRFDQAEVVVSLDCDFLGSLNGSTRYSRDFLSRRDLISTPGGMNRLYVAESGVSNTGAAADHRLPVLPSEILAMAREIARHAGLPGSGARPTAGEATSPRDAWISAVAQDLAAHPGRGLVIAGDRQPWQVHAIARLLNRHFENVGKTVEDIEPVAFEAGSQLESLRDLCAAIDAKEVDVLLILDTNPAYTAPADFDFAARLASVKGLAVHLGEYNDETAELCHWHVPQTHYLETWSDVRAYDGTVTIAQPLIAPLFGGKSPHEFLSAAIDETPVSAYEAVRTTWKTRLLDGSETAWTRAVHDGVVPETRHTPVSVTEGEVADVWTNATQPASNGAVTKGTESAKRFELILEVDPTIGDGRFANNGWLQELPKPWTRLTWGNPLLMSPAAAGELSLREGDVVSITAGDRSLDAAIFIVPGHPAGSATLYLGHGRKRGGTVANAYGVNAYKLRTSGEPNWIAAAEVRPIGRRERIACTQTHGTLEGRDEAIYRRLTFADFAEGETGAPHAGSHGTEAHGLPSEGAGHASHAPGTNGETPQTFGEGKELPTLYPDYNYPERAWGMVIDLTRCTGCNACVVACQVENNVPVVGKPGVLIGREMHWLRIDRYFAGEPENPDVLQQPMMCQHCEHAPCEVVCPVEATSHSSEGLNEMTYNRCVGTRYCSNNCPYKVRRFNFLRYSEDDSPLAMLRANPDVTVRSRGVMEKCTYCVQRINAARIEASTEAAHSGEPMKIADGAIVTACQSVCPGRAIQFGDLSDKESQVAKWREQPHAYGVLEELGVRPRTSYLARVTNPSSQLGSAAKSKTDPSPAKAAPVESESSRRKEGSE